MPSFTNILLLLGACVAFSAAEITYPGLPAIPSLDTLWGAKGDPRLPCVCGVFLGKQFTKGSTEQPTGHAVLMHEHSDSSPCNALGAKQCINRCLDQVIKYLPKSADILCSAVEEDCYRERAHLFIKNCDDKWTNTNMSAGREICCKDNISVKCAEMTPI